MGLKHPKVLESRDRVNKQTNKTKNTYTPTCTHKHTNNYGIRPKGTETLIRSSTERTPNGQSYNNLNKKINKVVLAYNQKYKINIDESILYK